MGAIDTNALDLVSNKYRRECIEKINELIREYCEKTCKSIAITFDIPEIIDVLGPAETT